MTRALPNKRQPETGVFYFQAAFLGLNSLPKYTIIKQI